MATAPVRSTILLGESWTDKELWDARHCLESTYEGVSAKLTAERMDELAERGLVHDVTRLPGRGRYAHRCTFMESELLGDLVRAAQAAGIYGRGRTAKAGRTTSSPMVR